MYEGASDEVLQWGFDETSLDGQSCMNQWCLIRTGTSVTIVTVECSGVLPDSTAAETVVHIKKTWERGQVAPYSILSVLIMSKVHVQLFVLYSPCCVWSALNWG